VGRPEGKSWARKKLWGRSARKGKGGGGGLRKGQSNITATGMGVVVVRRLAGKPRKRGDLADKGKGKKKVALLVGRSTRQMEWDEGEGRERARSDTLR